MKARKGQAAAVATIFLTIAFLIMMSFFAVTQSSGKENQLAQLEISQLLGQKNHEQLLVVANSTGTFVWNVGTVDSTVKGFVSTSSNGVTWLGPCPAQGVPFPNALPPQSSGAKCSGVVPPQGCVSPCEGVVTSLGNTFWQGNFSISFAFIHPNCDIQPAICTTQNNLTSVDVTVNFQGSFIGPVGLYVNDNPPGSYASFSPVTLTLSGQHSRFVFGTGTIPPGTYSIQVCGVNQPLTICKHATVEVLS